MRRVIAALVRWLGEALVRLYYPARTLLGGERIPVGRPVVFVLNHPNGLLDPLVLRVATGRPARFLAKSTLFGNPLGRLAMDAFDSIPIYRAHESRSGDRDRNEASFARCRAVLGAGGALALFPEGTSHSDPQLRPLKTGAARIALSAEAEHGGRLGLSVVPVGLYYEQKIRFRSGVLLVVGDPIEMSPRLAEYHADERGTVAALTEKIDAALDEVVLQAESRELLEGIARVARWHGPVEDLAARHARTRTLIAAYRRMQAKDPQRVEAIAAEARAFARILRRLGVRDPWALDLAPPRAAALAGAVATLAAAALPAVIGALLGWIPYRLAGEVAKRITRDEDLLGTVKLLTGAAFLLVAWSAEAVAVGVATDGWWGLATFGAAVACGYVALRFEELAREAVEAWRHLALRSFRREIAGRLIERRRALAEAVADALEEL